jgi:hypothetical protein
MSSRATSYFNEDATSRLPLYNPPINNLFTWGHTYCKASWLQHMLRYLEGDTTNTNGIFFQTMRVYGDSFRYGNATTDDYCRIHEQMTGLDLDWFFNEWVYQAGYPKYYYNWRTELLPNPNQYRIITQISQNNGNLAPAVFHMPLQFRFTAYNFDTTVTRPITMSPQIDTFILTASPSSMVLDPNNWVLKRIYLGIEENDSPLSTNRISLEVLPNPTRGQVKISYNLPTTQKAKITIYNRSGQAVKTFTANKQNFQIWDGKDELGKQVSSGVYFIKLTTQNKSYSEKIIFFQ